jgi:hydrogenase expression/formation protein HypE
VMHDPTEGGVLNGCWELGEASHLGVELWADKIPVAQETTAICSKLHLDPLKLMSSGCLLAVVDPRSVDRTVRLLRKIRVKVTPIGRMRPLSEGRKYSQRGRISDLVAVSRDELYKLA